MNKNYLIPFLFFLLAGTALLSAEEMLILTEQDAVDMAVGRNLSLQSTRLDVERSEEAFKNSWNVVLPIFFCQRGCFTFRSGLYGSPSHRQRYLGRQYLSFGRTRSECNCPVFH